MRNQTVINLIKILVLFFLIDSFSYPELSRDELICNNNFESRNLTEIEKGFRHSVNAVKIRFYYKLYLPNANDKDMIVQSKCDKGRSLENLKEKVISYT